jgi:hypothetical protein
MVGGKVGRFGSRRMKLLLILSVFSLATGFIRLPSGMDDPDWKHLSSADGDLLPPGPGQQQTASLILDVDLDGILDFVVTERTETPSVLWYRWNGNGWEKYVVDNTHLRIEAGGDFFDIDADGDLDISFGGDSSSNQVWWWENPYPNYRPDQPWIRRQIKNHGSNKHHDQIFGDFDHDGETELVFWNQGEGLLFMAEIPSNKDQEPWDMTPIFTYSSGNYEGLAEADVDMDGKVDIVGGGHWFKHVQGSQFEVNVIDPGQTFTRAAAGQLKADGWSEVVFVAGDGSGRLKWYEHDGTQWIDHDLLGFDVDHGHSLAIQDVNEDQNLDIFCAEMRLNGGNEDAHMWMFYGDGQGNFEAKVIAEGYGNHESKLGDLDGDGDIDILGKPYNWETPRLDIWLNTSGLSLDQWERHVIDPEKPWKSLFITAADIDGDGWKDILTGGWWYRNPGDPGGVWTRMTIGSPLNNMAAVFDLDGDGDHDILGTSGKGSDANAQFVWARNDGAGNFTIMDNIPEGQGDFLQGVDIDRFNSGEPLGIALSWHQAGQGVQMLTLPLNPVMDTWSWERITMTSQDEDLSAGDLDGDGDPDLLLGTKWLRNDGASWSEHTLSSSSEPPDRNQLADINSDGRLDAVVGFEAVSTLGKLVWYEQPTSPTGSWIEHLIAEVIGPMSLDVGDLDADGDLDVVVGEHHLADPASAGLYIFENLDGIGKEWAQHVVYVGDEHHDGAQIVDMDGDGDLDILSIGWGHTNVLLYENEAIDLGEPSEPTFADVSRDYWAFPYIEALYKAGYTSGCSESPLLYCPDSILRRSESAVFVERGIHGTGYVPNQPVKQIFADVDLGVWYAKWTTGLWDDGYTAGCATDPLMYCPDRLHTRVEGAVFYLRMLYGVDYVPPEAEGFFSDLDPTWWGTKWAEAAHRAGLIPPCGLEPNLTFCPEGLLDRSLAAYMMVQAKNLPLP